MKRFLSFVLSVVMTLLLVSCGAAGQKPSSSQEGETAGKSLHTLYYKDVDKREEVIAVFSNSSSKATEEVKMTAVGEDSDGFTYACEGDASAYNMVRFRYDGFRAMTATVAFNRCVSGWYFSRYGFLPYTEGRPDPYSSLANNRVTEENNVIIYDNEMYDDVVLPFKGYDKTVHIWTPADYDPMSSEKYGTVYLLDGQVMIYLGFPGEKITESEHADVQVQSMTAAAGYQAIVVAIDTYGDAEGRYSRLDEMIPDLGELAYEEETQKLGNEFADYIVDTVVPYVQQHYNVYTDALHTSVVGKSLGGLESFYVALEHPEIFGTAGVLSPSFMLYTDDVWRSYLGEKSFDDQAPFLYFYSGNEEQDNGDVTDEMVARIQELGYPADRFAYHRDEIGGHETVFWRSIFSEFLNAMVYRSVEPLQDALS